jgi:hypothetical protein
VVMEIISQREALLFEVYMYNCQFKDGSWNSGVSNYSRPSIWRTSDLKDKQFLS